VNPRGARRGTLVPVIDAARPSAAPRGGRARGRLPHPLTWVLAAGVLVQLLPLVLFPVVLSQDGAAHLDGAWVLVHHGDAGPVGAALRRQFSLDLSPVPNMFTSLVLAGLLHVVPADVAEKLLVAGFTVGLVAALGYAARGVDRRAGWLAAAALPLAGSQLASYGFYNFCWGVAGALVVLGMALRRRAGWTIGAAAGLGLLLVLTWSAHLLPFLLAAFGVLLLAALRTTAEVRGDGELPAALRRHVLPVVVAGIPAAVLSIRYAATGAGAVGGPTGGLAPSRIASLLTGFRPFVVLSWLELVPAVAVVGTLGFLAWRAARGRPLAGGDPDRWALAVLPVLAAVAYLVTPDQLGENFGFLPERLSWFPPLLLVLWAATRPAGRRLRLVATAVLVVAASVAVGIRLPAQAGAARQGRELLSVAGAIRPGSDLLVLRYSGSPDPVLPVSSRTPDYLRHESSRLAIRARSADVGMYEAGTPYFQVSFTGGPDVWRRITAQRTDLEKRPPRVDLRAARGLLDYVLVVGLDDAPAAVRSAPRTRAVLTELAGHYQQVEVSSPTGLVSVWRFRGAQPG
jgi:hypothetical protein